MEVAIEVENLTKKFGKLLAVDSLNLTINKGEVFGFLGPNGSGKTTAIRMLCGILEPTSGNGMVGGFDVMKEPEKIKCNIGYMSQKFSLYTDLTIQENLDFYSSLYGVVGKGARERKKDVLELVGLSRRVKQLAGNLSGGLKQRLALACALVHRPKILFLDEPTAGMDPVARRILWDLLFKLAGEGVCLFITTHYMDEAERCVKVAYVYYGKLLLSGRPEQMKQEEIAKTGHRIEVMCTPLVKGMMSLRGLPELEEVTIFGEALHVKMNSHTVQWIYQDHGHDFAVAAKRAYLMSSIKDKLERDNVVVRSVTSVFPTLEDIFVSFTRAEDAKREGQQIQKFD
ncbi:MAG: ABC transporter ATP-binding protein [Candidatus Brocadiales bacterium]|nr:ABC transporter ATP-binding protein [Candidatus Brocadiales bacterium]